MQPAKNSFPENVTYSGSKEGKPNVKIEGCIEGTPEEVIAVLIEITSNITLAYADSINLETVEALLSDSTPARDR